MSDSSSPIDRASRVPPTAPTDHRRERPPVAEPEAAPVEAASFDGIPASPPDEVLAEIDAAMGRLEDLRADGVSVAFGSTGRIELVGDDGARREIKPGELFDVVDGRRAADPSTPGTSTAVDRDAPVPPGRDASASAAPPGADASASGAATDRPHVDREA